ncbi:adenine deaminase [Sporomusa acidovorans]|uniref:Adenine deaminase n=1 Tax=Sporomusa acidovorans (strain ATCC 49682 / DSM 3132 / Mol) TaxID=1123286 RepID=A0ABZ3J559_SPOA4|nr:adenine deaminase [Sporomusa acidovorans]OZC15672.1 adenine deaminase [Sporomusa acidovorans DSM 3132]SDE88637.1 Adenine deaminase [Sporomusa acidovorans]
MKRVQELVDTALGRSDADLVLKNARVFNVFTGRFTTGDVAIVNGYIAGVGSYSGRKEIDGTGKFITPGFIDGHVHLESAMVSPAQFACAVVPSGTTTVIADPHEIANVAGLEGIRYMLKATEQLPLNVYMMLPSCVPATRLEHAGATLKAKELADFIHHPRILGLGEMMDYPGVLQKEAAIYEKIRLAEGKLVDGHAPGLTGRELTGYIAAGIRSDHECVTPEEATERLEQGMYVMLREGSAAHNLVKLLPAVNQYTVKRCLFATDDRHPADLIAEGHINHMVRLAIAAGADPAWVLQMATINVASYFRLDDLGAIAPGYRADLLVFDNLEEWRPVMVFKDGQLAAENGKSMFMNFFVDDKWVRNTLCLGELSRDKLRLPAHSSVARVIGLVPHQLVTEALELPVPVVRGEFVPDVSRDILKLVVWERHKGTGNVGVGLLQGLGLKRGAIASTIAHDSHNLVVVGTDDDAIMLAVKEIEHIQGGLVIAGDREILGTLPLPLTGLMTDRDIGEVQEKLAALHKIARSLGVKADYDPFMTLAFLSLPVIPALKLTDAGLIDVVNFQLMPVSVLSENIV